MKRYKLYTQIIVYLTCLQIVIASEMNDNILRPRSAFISFNALNGILLDRRQSMIVENFYSGIDIRVGWQTDDFDRNTFDCLFRYPKYGFGYYRGNLNHIILDPDKQTGFGKPHALYAFFASPIVREERFRFYYDISLGLSYKFDTYDPVQRPYNILVGANKNVYFTLQFSTEFILHERSALGVGVSYQHFSNGSLKKPNNGIDLLSVNLSYQTNLFENHEKSYQRFPIESYQPVWEWQFSLANGLRMLDTDFDPNEPQNGKRWHCSSISTAVVRQISHHRKIGLGFDYFYYNWGEYVIEYRAKTQGFEATTQKRDNMSLGTYVAHEAGYKNVWLLTHFGVYVTDHTGDNPQNPRIYERLGIKYCITPRLSLGVSIKAHLFIADYIEWTMGYSIKSKSIK